MSKIIFNTQTEWVNAMQKAATYSNAYSAQYPYNLLYWTGYTLFSDCLNFQKALFNGRNVYSMAPGTFQNNLSNTGDVSEYGLISQCTGVSSNFGALQYGYPELLYMDGHIGAYIGAEVWINGYCYNCIESTAWTGDFGHTGVIYTYVDSNGRRLNHKGGYINGWWTLHGKPTKWVKYVNPSPAPTPTSKLVVDGEWGVATTKATQRFFKTEVDGIISHQPTILRAYCLNCLESSWQWVNDGGYSPMIQAMQKWLGVGADGHFGPETIKALQRKLGVAIDGFCGYQTVSAWQKYLNDHMN